jgi:hypothetical protein
MESEVVRALLAGQEDAGYWGEPEQFYNPRFYGATWRLILLAELGADGSDERVKKAAEFLFLHSQDSHEGGFTSRYDDHDGEPPRGIPCLTGNMVWSLIRLGYLDDGRVQRGIEWIRKYKRFDDGVIVPPRPYWVGRYKADCWGKHTCMNGVIATLQALSEIPPQARSAEVQATLEEGADYILLHHVYKRSHNLSKPISQKYKQLGFPLLHQNDFLRMLLFLTAIGRHDERMQEAVDYLVAKQSKDGRWKLQRTFNDRMPVQIEEKGRPSKWITVRALMALKGFYG